MLGRRRIAQNVLSNWFALGVTTIVGFFLSPYVVHHLGNLAYGIWVIIASLVSYMHLLDLGLRGAVTRFVSKGSTQQDHEAASRAVCGALWIRLWISIAIIAAGVLLSAAFSRIFVIPADLQWTARVTLLVTAVTVSINLWSGVFRAVLMAFHRFDVTSSVSILQTCTRAAGFVLLLRSGDGILALATWELCTSIVANAATIVISFRIYPQLKFVFRRPDRSTIKQLLNYSFYVFLINVAVQVTYYTDNLVVGAFLSPSAVTLYAIGGILIGYVRQIVSSMSATFTPLASTFDAEGNQQNLRRLLIHGTRAALIISLPIEAALFVRGHTFIRLWMGEQYAQPSGTILQILLLSLLFSSANITSAGIVYGMEKHKRIALWAIVEGAANLILSITLIRRMGIYGVAWGTAIPSVIIELLLWPPYISKLLAVPVRTYLWQTWVRTSLAVLPFGLACELAEHFWPARNLAMFFVQIALLLPLLPGTVAIVFHEEVKTYVRRWIKERPLSRQLRDSYEPTTTALS